MSKQQASVDVLEGGNKAIHHFMGERELAHIYDYRVNCFYHSSWSWLMPVVRKIIDLKNNSFNNDLLLYKYISGRLTPILNEMLKVDIQNTWYCVVQFIIWHNTQTKKQ